VVEPGFIPWEVRATALHPELFVVSLGMWSTLTGGRISARPTRVPADASIVWIGGAATDEDARLVWETLTQRGVTRYAAVIADVAERLFRRDLARLGGVVDIGFFQPFYGAYARELLGQLDGSSVRIDRAR
jgi:hypothetical protein